MALVKELNKKGYTVYPINPKHAEINGMQVYASVKKLPRSVESLILAVYPERARSIISDREGTGIRRVWMNQGVGDGAWSEEGVELSKQNNLDFVYGFCPMMFFGGGLHKFHYWMRIHLGKTPAEFSRN
jgi:predicted CoA-binding protein